MLYRFAVIYPPERKETFICLGVYYLVRTIMFYHATLEDFGDEMRFTKGGYYEKTTESGSAEAKRVGGEFVGWKQSEIEQFCASKSPEAALFAKLQNLTNACGGHGDPEGTTTVHIYELSKEPDVDLSQTLVGDFALIEEVRYNNPAENPVYGEKHTTIQVPNRARGDVGLTYLPYGEHIIEKWGRAVKTALQTMIESGDYPDDSDSINGVQSPDIETYKNARV